MPSSENCSHHMGCAACHLEILDIEEDTWETRLPETALTIKGRRGLGCSVHSSMLISRSMGKKGERRFTSGCRCFLAIFLKRDLDTFLRFSMAIRPTIRAGALLKPGLLQRSCEPLSRMA